MKSLKQTQQAKVLELLKEAGINGVESYDLTYVYSIKQAPTRISELIEQGYQIASMPSIKNKRSVVYVLNYIPEELKKPVRYEFRDNRAFPVYE